MFIVVVVYRCLLQLSSIIVRHIRRLLSFVVVVVHCHRHHRSLQHSSIYLVLSGQPLPSIDIGLSLFILVDVPYSSNHRYCVNTYPITCSSRWYIGFLKLIHIYIFRSNMYIYVIFVLIHTLT